MNNCAHQENSVGSRVRFQAPPRDDVPQIERQRLQSSRVRTHPGRSPDYGYAEMKLMRLKVAWIGNVASPLHNKGLN